MKPTFREQPLLGLHMLLEYGPVALRAVELMPMRHLGTRAALRLNLFAMTHGRRRSGQAEYRQGKLMHHGADPAD